MVRSFVSAMRNALVKHPSPEDVESVINGTGVGAFVTSINAAIYAVGSFTPESAPFLIVWAVSTILMSLAQARMSRIAARVGIKRVSKRTARKLIFSTTCLALPWAILAFYVVALDGHGEPIVVLMICTGVLAGGAFMLHRAFTACCAYLATVLAGVTLSFYIGGWEEAWVVTAYAFVYGSFLAYFSYAAGETARQRDSSVLALSDAVRKLRQARDENHRLANTDVVTNLPNRKAFNEHLAAAVANQMEAGSRFALFLMDLDRFKNINDLFGHAAGDELLVIVAKRIRSCLKEGDVVARLGGDEFAVILQNMGENDDIRATADRILRTLSEPALLGGRMIYPGSSIGIAICPDHSDVVEELMLRADLALNSGKETGRGKYTMFDDGLRRKLVASDTSDAGLREALKEDRLCLVYQPKMNMQDGSCIGGEALLRWQDAPERSTSPETFLRVASERGLLPEISHHVVEMLARDIRAWREAGVETGKIALNLHPDDLKSAELLMQNIELLESKGITGDDVVLEITEGCFVGRGTDQALFLLDALSERGYELSLDDFGTGHASLSHLKSIPVAEIKIDKSFVSNIGGSKGDLAIVSGMVEIARGMGIRSVAEGVEEEAQLEILKRLGVDVGQGYLWSRPFAPEDFASFIVADRTGWAPGGTSKAG